MLASVTITDASPTDADGVPYETLGVDVTLFESVEYVIGSEEHDTTGDGDKDQWRDNTVLTPDTDYLTSIATIGLPMIRADVWGVPDTEIGGDESRAFGYPTMYVADLLPAWQPWRGW